MRKLTSRSSLENLKREAKRWLKALREHDAAARARLEAVLPHADPEPALRDVQHALALEHGASGWNALTAQLDALAQSPGDIDRAAALTALLDASAHGDLARVTEVLDAHPDIVSERGTLRRHSGLRTALHFAVAGSHEDIVKLLLHRGADPNVRDEGDNAMPLHFAAEKEQLGIITLLIEHGADPIGSGDGHELEVIGWATCFGTARRDVVDYLLAHGARHNIYSAVATGSVADIRTIVAARPEDRDKPMDGTNHRRTPLHLAVVKQQPASLAALLELGADTTRVDVAGLTPLDQAALDGNTEVARQLLDQGATLTFPAAIALDRDAERMLADNPGALAPGGRWETLILRAAEKSPGPVIERLIRHGVSVDVHDNPKTAVDSTIGYTPLHAAAFKGNLAAAKVLLAHGASVTARDGAYHGTPAGWADHAGHADVRDLILQGPIDFFDAIFFDRVSRIRELFDREPDALNRRMGRSLIREPEADEWTKAWWSPLAFAVVNGKTDAARELIELGARPTIRDPEDRTLIEIARGMGRDDLVQLLDQYAPRLPTADGSLGQLVARFLTNACPDHHVRGGWSHAVASDTAARMLEQNQEIARFDIYTAVVCGDIDEVRRILARDPDQARAKGGPKGSYSVAGEKFIVEPTATTVPFWEPLLYLCFTRLPTRAANENAVDIARLLLDHGADPNSYFMAGDSRYSPLTGVIGEGEESRKGHPRRDELTRLLLERGANPYDVQVFYNIHFQGNVLWYLELAYEYSLKNGRAADWKDPRWSMIDMGGYGLGARYLLTIAVNHDDTALAEWVLEHGADPNAELPAHSKLSKESLYDQAVRRGHLGVASLLARYGAKAGKEPIDDEERFVAAALRGDGAELERLAIAHPELLRSTRALFAAAEKDRADVVAMLLDLGTSVDVQDN
ncbi:MAG TPA: ankyrin repeat domain-containing protein, partial [Gemmatimonadaceae bacterium]